MLTHQPSSPHYELWAGNCTGKIRRPRLPRSSGLECPFCSVAEAKEKVAASLSLISAFPLQVPHAQGTSCSATWIHQYNSVGDWSLIKLHQLDSVDKTYTYCLTHPSQALAWRKGKASWGNKLLRPGTILASTTQPHRRTYHWCLQLNSPWNTQGRNHLSPVPRCHVGPMSQTGLITIE